MSKWIYIIKYDYYINNIKIRTAEQNKLSAAYYAKHYKWHYGDISKVDTSAEDITDFESAWNRLPSHDVELMNIAKAFHKRKDAIAFISYNSNEMQVIPIDEFKALSIYPTIYKIDESEIDNICTVAEKLSISDFKEYCKDFLCSFEVN